MSEVGSENKISHAPGRAAAPASLKLLLHTLPAALLLALKQPPCNPSHSRVRKARGPRRDKPIVLLAAIRREMLALSMPAKTLAVVVLSAAVCQKYRGVLSTAGETVTRALCAILGPILRREWA